MRSSLIVSLLFIAGCTSSLKHDSTHKASMVITYDDHRRPIGCSWYCGAPPISVTASSNLRDGIYSYDPVNIHDHKKDTVWAEGTFGPGIGTTVTFTFDCTGAEYRDRVDNPLGISSLSLINGFARSPELWAANGRVKTFKVSFNGAAQGAFSVEDTAKPQNLKLPDLTFPPGKKSTLVLEIAEVYPGSTHEDTCIADIVFDGYGTH